MTAARSLAELGDTRARRPLVQLLASHDSQVRWDAFIALSAFSDNDFGFDPDADRLDRATALGRWQAWLEATEAP